jgi:hypothetical protein
MNLLNEMLRTAPTDWGDACIYGWNEACVARVAGLKRCGY